MGNKENKKNFSFWLDPKTDGVIYEGVELSKSVSRSEFVQRAIDHYVKNLKNEKEGTALVVQAIREMEKHMASILFRIAGEQANLNLIIGDVVYDLPNESLRWYRNQGYDIVRKRQGAIEFRDAVKLARLYNQFESDEPLDYMKKRNPSEENEYGNNGEYYDSEGDGDEYNGN